MTVTVRNVKAGDHDAWARLYAGYADFYKVTQTAAMRATVWEWLHDPTHEVEGLVAADENGRIIGIAHFRPYMRPLSASVGGFLDDLFVDPQLQATGFWKEVEHPTEGRLRMPDIPPRFSKTKPEITRLQPRLGEHSVEVLKEAGFTATEIDAMLKSGATKTA